MLAQGIKGVLVDEVEAEAARDVFVDGGTEEQCAYFEHPHSLFEELRPRQNFSICCHVVVGTRGKAVLIQLTSSSFMDSDVDLDEEQKLMKAMGLPVAFSDKPSMDSDDENQVGAPRLVP